MALRPDVESYEYQQILKMRFMHSLAKERPLVVLSGAARYEWQYAIPARKSDMINGIKISRKRRISLTFRKVKLSASP